MAAIVQEEGRTEDNVGRETLVEVSEGSQLDPPKEVLQALGFSWFWDARAQRRQTLP